MYGGRFTCTVDDGRFTVYGVRCTVYDFPGIFEPLNLTPYALTPLRLYAFTPLRLYAPKLP